MATFRTAQDVYKVCRPKPKPLLQGRHTLIRHGPLLYFSPNTRTRKPRYFFLFNDALLLTKGGYGPKSGFWIKIFIHLRKGITVTRSADKDNGFQLNVQLQNGTRTFNLWARNSREMEAWLRDLQQVLWVINGRRGPDPGFASEPGAVEDDYITSTGESNSRDPLDSYYSAAAPPPTSSSSYDSAGYSRSGRGAPPGGGDYTQPRDGQRRSGIKEKVKGVGKKVKGGVADPLGTVAKAPGAAIGTAAKAPGAVTGAVSRAPSAAHSGSDRVKGAAKGGSRRAAGKIPEPLQHKASDAGSFVKESGRKASHAAPLAAVGGTVKGGSSKIKSKVGSLVGAGGHHGRDPYGSHSNDGRDPRDTAYRAGGHDYRYRDTSGRKDSPGIERRSGSGRRDSPGVGRRSGSGRNSPSVARKNSVGSRGSSPARSGGSSRKKKGPSGLLHDNTHFEGYKYEDDSEAKLFESFDDFDFFQDSDKDAQIIFSPSRKDREKEKVRRQGLAEKDLMFSRGASDGVIDDGSSSEGEDVHSFLSASGLSASAAPAPSAGGDIWAVLNTEPAGGKSDADAEFDAFFSSPPTSARSRDPVEASRAAERDRERELARVREKERLEMERRQHEEAQRVAEAQRAAEANRAAEAFRLAESQKAAEAERAAEARRMQDTLRAQQLELEALRARERELQRIMEAQKKLEEQRAALEAQQRALSSLGPYGASASPYGASATLGGSPAGYGGAGLLRLELSTPASPVPTLPKSPRAASPSGPAASTSTPDFGPLLGNPYGVQRSILPDMPARATSYPSMSSSSPAFVSPPVHVPSSAVGGSSSFLDVARSPGTGMSTSPKMLDLSQLSPEEFARFTSHGFSSQGSGQGQKSGDIFSF